MRGFHSRKLLGAALIFAALLGLLAVLRSGRRNPTIESVHAAYPGARIYDTWDDFLSAGERTKRGRAIFIGMDGATWNVIDPMIEAGELPAFARIKREGAYGVLLSGDCYVSPPAWVSMMTGMRPEHHGIYTFGKWDGVARKFITYSSEDVAPLTVWDAASAAGMRVAVTNMAVTYPAQPVNGLMVTGMLTPIMLDDTRPKFFLRFYPYSGKLVQAIDLVSYAPVLRTIFNLFSNSFVILLYDSEDDGSVNYDRGVVTVIPPEAESNKEARVRYYHFDLDGYSPWLKISYRKGRKERKGWCQIKVDTSTLPKCEVKASPVYFTPDDPEIHYTYPGDFGKVLAEEFEYYFPYTPFDRHQIKDFVKDAARYARFFYRYESWDLFIYLFSGPDHAQHVFGDSEDTRDVYRSIDRFLEWLLGEMGEDDLLVISSDHGFQGYKYSLDMSSFLAGIGLLEWDGEGGIDYDRSLAFYNMWTIYFNDSLLTGEELQKRGVELPDGLSPKQALKAYIERKGREIVHPKTGLSMPVEFTDLPEDALGSPPDLIVKGTYDGYMVEFWDRKNPHTGIVRELAEDETWNHKRDGIYLAWGRGISRAYQGKVEDIENIAPTLLYALGVPLPVHLDGTVMADIFEPGYIASNPVSVALQYTSVAKASTVPEEEREQLEKKLKSLGYIK